MQELDEQITATNYASTKADRRFDEQIKAANEELDQNLVEGYEN